MLPMLKREGRVVRAWVGLRADRVTSEVAARARLARPTGALITSVVASGPAERAGLRVGDIILRFDSREVIGSNELAWLVVTAGVNRAVPVNAWRAGKPITLSLRTERMPE
jgi:serine protease Do